MLPNNVIMIMIHARLLLKFCQLHPKLTFRKYDFLVT